MVIKSEIKRKENVEILRDTKRKKKKKKNRNEKNETRTILSRNVLSTAIAYRPIVLFLAVAANLHA